MTTPALLLLTRLSPRLTHPFRPPVLQNPAAPRKAAPPQARAPPQSKFPALPGGGGLPSIGGPSGGLGRPKAASASPSRPARPAYVARAAAPLRPTAAVAGGGALLDEPVVVLRRSADASPGRERDLSPGGGWNLYNKEMVKPRGPVRADPVDPIDPADPVAVAALSALGPIKLGKGKTFVCLLSS